MVAERSVNRRIQRRIWTFDGFYACNADSIEKAILNRIWGYLEPLRTIGEKCFMQIGNTFSCPDNPLFFYKI